MRSLSSTEYVYSAKLSKIECRILRQSILINMTSISILHIFDLLPHQNSTLFVKDNSLSHLNRVVHHLQTEGQQLPFSLQMTFLLEFSTENVCMQMMILIQIEHQGDETEGEIVASVTYVTLKLGTLLTTLGYPRGVRN